MEKIKKFKLILERHLGETTIYELDADLKKEKFTEILGKKIKEEEKDLESVNFLEKIYEIEKNASKLENEYINNNMIDGVKIKIYITYINNKIKNIICKNKIPNEVEKIIDVINI